jgi:hypothetical protein
MAVAHLNGTDLFYVEVGEGRVPRDARRTRRRSHLPSPLARPFGRRDASGLLARLFTHGPIHKKRRDRC